MDSIVAKRSCIVFIFFIFVKYSSSGTYSSTTDVCSLPKVVGPCEALIPRYYFDEKTGLCTLFQYGGCKGNGNNFQTKEECVRVCGCKAPAKTGFCKAYFERYYFDKNYFRKSGQCKLFVYGGCGANENNFNTNKECLKACVKQ